MENLVSIIIPTYGGGEFINRAVDSVLSQTYQDIEVIVVDDNGLGTENQIITSKRMVKYENNKNVKYICHDVNKNGSAARNTGFRNSRGDYIALLDDDDLYYPERIAKQLNFLKSLGEDYALVYCGCDLYQGGKKIGELHPVDSNDLLFDLLTHNMTIESSSILMRRSAFEKIGGFDESFRRHQDWEFTARIAAVYKMKSIDIIGIRRYLEFRNSAKSPDQVKQYREHYLDKMKPYIDSLSDKKKKEVFVRNRVDVAIQYLKKMDIVGFLKEYRNARPGFKGLIILINHVMNYIKKR